MELMEYRMYCELKDLRRGLSLRRKIEWQKIDVSLEAISDEPSLNTVGEIHA